MTTREKAELLVRWGIQIKQIATKANYNSPCLCQWLNGKINISSNAEARIAEAVQFYIDQLHDVLEILEGAESAISKQSSMSKLQTAENGEATK